MGIILSGLKVMTQSRSRSASRSRSRSFSRSRSRSRAPPDGVTPHDWKSLFIGYLPNHATMDDVEDFFKGYGDIVAISLKPGYGFVTMSHRSDAERIVRELDGKKMAGERVDIQHSKSGQKKSDTRNRQYSSQGHHHSNNDQHRRYRPGQSRS